jgi:branched-chain amino acid transport system ATP-binding protein
VIRANWSPLQFRFKQYLYLHIPSSKPKIGDPELLQCIAVSKEFGGLQALKKVDLTVKQNSITGLVGPNGSGKSTLLNVISGVYKPDSGKILFLNEDISKLPPYAICSRGVTKTSQTVQSFPDMTTIENVLIGVLFARKQEKKDIDSSDKAKELLDFVGLGADKVNVPAKSLNVVELRRVQLARALATKPKLLLLDELLTGLTPKECDEAIALVKLINKKGVTILMVEHVMKVIMGLCETVTVLHHGEKICDGTPGEVCNDKGVREVYLGKKFAFGEE